jgi:hypothetical protein
MEGKIAIHLRVLDNLHPDQILARQEVPIWLVKSMQSPALDRDQPSAFPGV